MMLKISSEPQSMKLPSESEHRLTSGLVIKKVISIRRGYSDASSLEQAREISWSQPTFCRLHISWGSMSKAPS
jgi:hypothetical protein